MKRRIYRALIGVVLSAGACAAALGDPGDTYSLDILKLTAHSGGNVLIWNQITEPYAAIHFIPGGSGEQAGTYVKAVLKNAESIAGLAHVFVLTNPGIAGASAAIPSDAAGRVYIDANGEARRAVDASGRQSPLIVILGRDNREIMRSESNHLESFPTWSEFASNFAASTRLPALAHYNLPKGKTLAVEGYDVVAYHTQSKAQKGKPEFASSYGGATYHFATAENRSLFGADPEKYLPTYGGWCASAMGAKAEKVEIDPKNFKIKDGRLHLFYKDFFSDALKDWNKHEREWEPAADTNWKKLTGEDPVKPAR